MKGLSGSHTKKFSCSNFLSSQSFLVEAIKCHTTVVWWMSSRVYGHQMYAWPEVLSLSFVHQKTVSTQRHSKPHPVSSYKKSTRNACMGESEEISNGPVMLRPLYVSRLRFYAVNVPPLFEAIQSSLDVQRSRCEIAARLILVFYKVLLDNFMIFGTKRRSWRHKSR